MTDEPVTDPRTPSSANGGRRSRRWRWALVVSLALNLFLGGAMIGGWAAGVNRPPPPEAFDMSFQGIARDLPPEVRATLRQAFLDERENFWAAADAVRIARREVYDALIADDFSEETMAAALASLRQATVDAQSVVHNMMASLGDELGPEGRAALAEAARQRFGGRHGNGPPSRDHGQGPPGDR